MKRLLLPVCIIIVCCTIGLRGNAQNLLFQNFDGATFPPAGWQNNLIVNAGTDNGPLVWVQSTGGIPIGTYSSAPNGHSGTHAAGWNSWDIHYGGTADLVTPAINLAAYPGGTNTLTFWSYRYSSDPVYVYVNTVTTSGGGTLLATINSYTTGWVQTTATIPASYAGNIYIIFHAVSSYGNDMFFDDVSVDHVGCSGTPAISSIINVPLATPACSGTTVTLSALDPNTAPGIIQQWQQSASASGPWSSVVGGSGANTLNYTTAALTTSVYYRMLDSCVNSHIGIATAAYYVPVTPATTVTTQPQPSNVCATNNASFSVTAGGTNLSYQWQVNTGSGFNNITNGGVYSNATTSTLNITGATLAMNNYQYRAVVTGTCGSVNSNAATLSVGPTPTVVTQPHDTTICAFGTGAIGVTAAGIGLTYQWQVNTGSGFTPITNGGVYTSATSATLFINSATASMNGYQYQAIISGACNPIYSNIVTLHVNTLPAITSQPGNTNTCNGATTTISVGATGSGLNYQWQVNTGSGFNTIPNGGGYSGATTNTLTITGATLGMNGYRYQSIVTGACAPVLTTNPDTLRVNPVVSVPPITALGNTVICPSDSVLLTNTYAPTYTYQWYFNGAPIPAATRDTFKANPAGSYTLAVTNGFGCTTLSAPDTISYLPAPVSSISANGSLSFCLGNSVTLNANPNVGVTYYWKKNGVYISGATNSSYQATVSGNYTLYQNNGTCGTLSAPVTVTATAQPLAAITPLGAVDVCPGSTVNLKATQGNGYTYQWLLNNNTIPAATANIYAAGNPGNYTVQVFSGPGCYSTSSILTVTNLPAPSAVITPAGNTAICSGGAALLNANAVANAGYQWNLNNTPISSAISNGYSATASGSYSVTITGVNGCSTTSSPIVITALPSVTAPIVSNKPDTVCAPDSIILSSLYGAGLTHTWYVNGVAQSNTTDTFIVHNTGDYSVMVANAGCSATSTIQHVAVGTTPTGNIGYGQPGAICGNTPTLLQAPSGAGYTYQWYLNNGLISGVYSGYYQASAAGSYTVKVTAPFGCQYTTPAVAIVSGTIPTPVIGQFGAQLCAPGFTTYQWYFNGLAIPGETSSCTNIASVGGYLVTVTNSTGCSGTSTVYSVKNLSVGNMNNIGTQIRLYPNPATSIIHIDAPVAVNISVMSIEGRLLLHQDNANAVNIENLADGMYLVALYDQDNHLLKTEKIVKN